ncbi:hypothetical protein [Deinococcus roseus]|uniref:Transposase n=1 Tax=Deinococcus roseus TaxID=392414 RepID=A0ABQ2DBV0_9DEIO|nr:hypothetical protein [Deinococcus roseus]GGJ51360.1 hypothetical protein GCM10008938_41670 [Deinococcus roseus]
MYFHTWKEKWFGLFKKDVPGLRLTDYIDPDWDLELVYRVSEYLKKGIIYIEATTEQRFICSMCKKDLGYNGVMMTDGVFVWPHVLSHYVEFHKVRIPDNFLKHILEVDFKMIEDSDDIDLDNLPFS